MAITDLARRVMIRIQGDATGFKAATEEVRRSAKSAADEVIKGLTAQDGAVSKLIATLKDAKESWGDINSVAERGKRIYGDVTAAFEKFSDAHNFYIERSTKLASIHNIELGRLDKAAAGTRSQTQLLADAVAYQNGIFKANESAIETAILAERKLARSGADLEQVHNAITAALTKGEVDGLRPFGIAIDKAGASMDDAAGRTKIFNALMLELGKLAGDAGLAHRTAAEDIAAAGAKNTNSLDSIKNSIGSVVDALKPLTSVAADALGGLAELIDQVTDATRRQREETIRGRMMKKFQADYDAANNFGKTDLDRKAAGGWFSQQSGYAPGVVASFSTGGIQDKWFDQRLMDASRVDKATELATAAAKSFSESIDKVTGALTGAFSGGGKGGGGGAIAAVRTLEQALARVTTRSTDAGFGSSLGDASATLYRGDMDPRFSRAKEADVFSVDLGKARSDAMSGALTDDWKKRMKGYDESRKTFMEKTFGPVGQFDVYKAAWDGFTGSVTAGYNAMVDGTMGFGQAFKSAVSQALKATGAQMLVESLKETAYAIAALARGIGGNPAAFAEAATHGKAALAFGAAAVAAGVVASGLGGGGGSPATSPGVGAAPGAGATGYNGAAARGASDRIIVINDPLAENTPRERAGNFKRQVERAIGSPIGGEI